MEQYESRVRCNSDLTHNGPGATRARHIIFCILPTFDKQFVERTLPGPRGRRQPRGTAREKTTTTKRRRTRPRWRSLRPHRSVREGAQPSAWSAVSLIGVAAMKERLASPAISRRPPNMKLRAELCVSFAALCLQLGSSRPPPRAAWSSCACSSRSARTRRGGARRAPRR